MNPLWTAKRRFVLPAGRRVTAFAAVHTPLLRQYSPIIEPHCFTPMPPTVGITTRLAEGVWLLDLGLVPPLATNGFLVDDGTVTLEIGRAHV